MTADDLSDYLTLASYASQLGQGGTLNLVVVPEPSAGVLALLAVVAATCRLLRRRQV